MIRHTAGFDITVKDKALYLNKKIRKHNQIILQEINFANNVLMCDCCTLYITFITANNVLYVYDPNNTTYSVDFTKIANNVTTVSCGYEHTAYISNGALYNFIKIPRVAYNSSPTNSIDKISDNVTTVKCNESLVIYTIGGELYFYNPTHLLGEKKLKSQIMLLCLIVLKKIYILLKVIMNCITSHINFHLEKII